MPIPVSRTTISALPFSRASTSEMSPPSGVYFTALSSRLRIIRLISSSSPFKSIAGQSFCRVNRTPLRKGVRLTLQKDWPAIDLNGDEELIRRMILNLLDNAVKYTPEGGDISLVLAREN